MHGEKIEYAKQVAGALSFVALGQSDRVVIAGLNEAMSHYSPARRGRKATKPLFDTLVSMNANGQTDIPRALMRCRDNAVHPFGCSLRIFCLKTASNLRFENFVVVGENCTCFHLFSPSELHPSLRGDVLLVDQRTGEEMAFSANPQRLQQYTESVMRWADDIEAKCRKRGGWILSTPHLCSRGRVGDE